MSHQIRCYLSISDTSDLEKELLEVDEVLILHDRSRGPFPRVVESTDLVEDGQRQHFFYFVRKSDLELVITQEITTQGYWAVDGMFSPVIEFLTRNFDGVSLKPGRLYYNDSYYDSSNKLVGKAMGFSDWARKMFSKARRVLTYDKELQAYLGSEAAKLRDAGIDFAGF